MIVYLIGSVSLPLSKFPYALILRYPSQPAELEIPIGFAQSFGVVMGSRLCLNVREYIRNGQTAGILSSPVSPHSGGGFVSVGGGGVSALVQSAPGLGGLNEVELRELRVMRASSQRHEKGGVLPIRPGR